MTRVLATLSRCWPPALRRLAGDRRGVSAVEFAMIAPLMIALYFGCVEVSDGVAVYRKVSLTATALANLTAQVTSGAISTTDMNNILDASTTIISPYAVAPLKMSVSCLKFDANKNMTVKWTVTRNGTVPTISVPSALQVANSQLIYAEVSYLYTPVVGYTISGSLNLADHMYMAPRTSAPAYGTTSCS